MKKFRDFESAREFVRKLGLKSGNEWREYVKSGNKPDDIPSNLDKYYKNKGWISMGDFLGTGRIADQKKKFLSFNESRKFVHSLNLKSKTDWKNYCISGNKPNHIHSNPNIKYKNEWKGYGDWLGTGSIKSGDKHYRSFESAREFVRKLGLKSHNEWKVFCKSGNKPDDIHITVDGTYKNDWKGWVAFLGNGNMSTSDIKNNFK